MTNLSAATAQNPSNLSPRYEIRRLTEEHLPWVKAIFIHANMFYSPIWPNIYPDGKAARSYRIYEAADYLVRHQIASGYSFGVFDLEYQFKREDSKPAGKLHWDFQDVSLDADALESQMDFPLVSIALAYDGINQLDPDKMTSLVACIPAFNSIYNALAASDTRSPVSWQPTAAKQVLMRNSTATKHAAEGKGIMKKLAHFLTRHVADQGFRGIQIETLADAVEWVWTHPPSPFQATVVSAFECATYEEDEEIDGSTRKVNPFLGFPQRATKIYVDLKP